MHVEEDGHPCYLLFCIVCLEVMEMICRLAGIVGKVKIVDRFTLLEPRISEGKAWVWRILMIDIFMYF